jgi:hypothetical protein
MRKILVQVGALKMDGAPLEPTTKKTCINPE